MSSFRVIVLALSALDIYFSSPHPLLTTDSTCPFPTFNLVIKRLCNISQQTVIYYPRRTCWHERLKLSRPSSESTEPSCGWRLVTKRTVTRLGVDSGSSELKVVGIDGPGELQRPAISQSVSSPSTSTAASASELHARSQSFI